jgi:L-ascorbate metabolism protein UlaG (beta-lactamase superfamily)
MSAPQLKPGPASTPSLGGRFQAWDSLDAFFESTDDGVLYVGHASILARLSGKTFLFDPVGYSSPYFDCWVFFPEQVMDPRLLEVDAVIVSHCHQDHFDTDFLKLFPKKTPIYIVEGRPMFSQMCADAGVSVVELPADRLTTIASGVEIYAILHETNGIDASMVIRNDNLSVYHGNDNYVSAATLAGLKQAVGRVDIGCVPFAYIHWYPFLLEGVDPDWRDREARRLMDQYLDKGIEQAEILDAEVVIPFGANLVYFDDANSVMNRAVLSPLDFVAYAQGKPARNSDRYRPMFAGDIVMKPRPDGRQGVLEIACKPRQPATFKMAMQSALLANPNRPTNLPAEAVDAAPLDLSWLEARLKRHSAGTYDHTIRLEGPGERPLKIEVDLKTQTAAVVKDWQSAAPYHHFRIEAEPMLRWLNQEVTLEGVIGMRRFHIERVPERYDPEILAVINGAL